MKIFNYNIHVSAPYLIEGLGKCLHGPKNWPKWKLFSLNLVDIDTNATVGIRLWIYTRNNGRYIDLFINKIRNYKIRKR